MQKETEQKHAMEGEDGAGQGTEVGTGTMLNEMRWRGGTL